MTFCWWQMVIATRCCLDICLLTGTVEPLWTGHSLFLILSHLSTFSNFHPSIDILVPSRSAHKPAKRKSLSRHICRLDTAYTNIDKQKCTPKTNKSSVSQLSGDGKRERFETYSIQPTVLCFVFGLRCLSFVLYVCVVNTTPTGRTSIYRLFHLTMYSFIQTSVRVFSVLIVISSVIFIIILTVLLTYYSFHYRMYTTVIKFGQSW